MNEPPASGKDAAADEPFAAGDGAGARGARTTKDAAESEPFAAGDGTGARGARTTKDAAESEPSAAGNGAGARGARTAKEGAGAPRIGAAGVFALALAVRIAVVAWAADRIPPVADGTFYHTIATRIAQGLGYTWLWPDGVVTHAGHYPVGYPALVGAMYALAGPRPVAAMVLNAALGALAAVAAYRLVERAGGRRAAAAAGVLVALHPGLVSYTPALMTEGVTAALVVCGAWAAGWSPRDHPAAHAPPGASGEGADHSMYPNGATGLRGAPWRAWVGPVLTGVVLGVATLVRPQSLVLAPIFGWLAARTAAGAPRAPAASARDGEVPAPPSSSSSVVLAAWRGGLARRLGGAALALVAALAVCAPWAARNCARMGRCALVSYNGGWNLLIGADEASTGTWAEIKVPPSCREVFDEAGKDACFGAAARRYIAEHPAAWLALVPRKLAATFDYAGAGAWYLHTASPAAFPERVKVALGAVETAFERLALLVALLVAARPAVRALRRRKNAPVDEADPTRVASAARTGEPRGASAAEADHMRVASAAALDEPRSTSGAEPSRTSSAAALDEPRSTSGAVADSTPTASPAASGRSRRARALVTVLMALPAAASVFWVHVWIGYLLLPLVLLTAPHAEKLAARPFGEGAGSRPTLISTTAAVIVSLCVTHAVFFGAGRYSLVAFPFVTAVAALAFARRPGSSGAARAG